MIKSFKDKDLENCWLYGRCGKVKSEIRRRTLMKLESMDAATCLDDLKNPPSNHLHQLKGNYKSYWAISVNGPWRLIFKYENGHIYEVWLEQYH